MEQDQVVTIDIPFESPAEFPTDVIAYEDKNHTTSDQSDFHDSDNDFKDMEEMKWYNLTEGSDVGARKFSVPKRYNLDIIDNTHCIDGYFTPYSNGRGVDIYIIDSGINYRNKDFR